MLVIFYWTLSTGQNTENEFSWNTFKNSSKWMKLKVALMLEES